MKEKSAQGLNNQMEYVHGRVEKSGPVTASPSGQPNPRGSLLTSRLRCLPAAPLAAPDSMRGRAGSAGQARPGAAAGMHVLPLLPACPRPASMPAYLP